MLKIIQHHVKKHGHKVLAITMVLALLVVAAQFNPSKFLTASADPLTYTWDFTNGTDYTYTGTQIAVSGSKASLVNGTPSILTNSALDFDLADEGTFVQQDAANGTDFLAGAATLHNTGGTQYLADYEGYATPLLENWTSEITSVTEDATAGILHVTESYNSYQYKKQNVNMNATNGFTIEARAKITTAAGDGNTLIWFTRQGDYQGGKLSFYTTGTERVEYNGQSIPMDIHSDYHTYKLVVTGTTTNVYVDGVLKKTVALSQQVSMPFGNMIIWGDATNGYASNTYWDYVRVWDNTLTQLPVYPTSTWNYITTSATNSITSTTWAYINNVRALVNEPAGTETRYLVSFDNRATWKYWDGGAWVNSNLASISSGMTKTTLEGLNNTTWQAAGGFNPGVTTKLDFAIGMYSTDTNQSPLISQFYVYYLNGSYPTTNPTIVNKVAIAPSYSTLLSFSETLGGDNLGSMKYQLSKDNVNWSWWNGSAWATTSQGYTESNDAATINSHMAAYNTQVGAGKLYVRTYIHSDSAIKIASLDSLAITYTYTPPIISNVSVSAGPAIGGTPVTITGSNFEPTAVLKFGNNFGVNTSITSTEITSVIPSGDEGAVNITVTNPNGEVATVTNGYTYNAAPFPTAASPNTGANSGTLNGINITGGYFDNGAVVRLIKTGESDIVCSTTFGSAASLTASCNLTNATPGTWSIKVTNPDTQTGTFYSGFTVKDTIRSIAIVSSAQTIPASTASYPIVVEARNRFGQAVSETGAYTINLTTDSPTGSFSINKTVWTATSVSLAANQTQATFWYKDTTAGAHTITATGSTWTPVSQVVTIDNTYAYEFRYDAATEYTTDANIVLNPNTSTASLVNSTTGTQTDSSLVFTTATEANYTQESAANGTDFGSNKLTLHDAAGHTILARYDANSGRTPNNDGWSVNQGVATVNAVENNILHTRDTGTMVAYSKNSLGLSQAAGINIEIKAKFASTASSGAADGYTLMIFRDSTTDRGGFLSFYPNKVVFAGQTYTMDASTAFHTYRVFANASGVKLYVDGTQVISAGTQYQGIASAGQVQWGDGSSMANHDAFWDHLYVYSGPDSALSYPTSNYYVTTNTNRLSVNTWESIQSVNLNQSAPTGTDIRYLVSFDGGTTWKYYRDGAWTTSGLAQLSTSGMTKTELEALTTTEWGADGGFTKYVTPTLDFAMSLSSTDSTVSPAIGTINVNYLKNTYSVANPTIYNNTNNTFSYVSLTGFEEVAGSGNLGTAKYQLSVDGTAWYFYNGSSWVPGAGTNYAQTNDAATINENIGSFAQAMGPGQLRVRAYLHSNTGRDLSSLNTVRVNYSPNPPPSISTITPAFGGQFAQNRVTISGNNFMTGATVNFGNRPGLVPVVVDSHTITVTAPALPLGFVNVIVRNPDNATATEINGYEYRNICPASTLDSQDISITNPNQETAIADLSMRNVINFNSNISTAKLNLSGIIQTTGGRKIARLPNTLITNTTISHPVQVEIPQCANASSTETWSGNISIPYEKNTDSVTAYLPDLRTGSSNVSVNSVISIGDATNSIDFDKAVRIKFTGMAGKKSASISNSTVTKITSECSADTQEAGDALAEGTACYIDVDSDLIVWTKHFSDFVVYDEGIPPIVTGVLPTTGSIDGGTLVTVTGSNFGSEPGNPATVTFGGVACTGVDVDPSGNSLTCTTGAHAAGVVDIEVTNPNPVSGSGTGVGLFTYSDLTPTITDINPNTGSVAGGTAITITGTNFIDGDTTVVFDPVTPTPCDITSIDETTINCTTRAHAAGLVDVTVSTSNGDAISTFTYEAGGGGGGDGCNGSPGPNQQCAELNLNGTIDIWYDGYGTAGNIQNLAFQDGSCSMQPVVVSTTADTPAFTEETCGTLDRTDLVGVINLRNSAWTLQVQANENFVGPGGAIIPIADNLRVATTGDDVSHFGTSGTLTVTNAAQDDTTLSNNAVDNVWYNIATNSGYTYTAGDVTSPTNTSANLQTLGTYSTVVNTTGVTILSTAQTDAFGIFAVAPSYELDVPAGSPAVTYTNTITYTVL